MIDFEISILIYYLDWTNQFSQHLKNGAHFKSIVGGLAMYGEFNLYLSGL